MGNSSICEISLDSEHSATYNIYLTNKLNAYELEGKSQKGKVKRKEYRIQDTEYRIQEADVSGRK